METKQNIAETIRDLTLQHGDHEEIENNNHDFTRPHLVSMPEKRRVEDLTDKTRTAAEYLKPARRIGTAKLKDLASLIDWANRFKGDTSALFAKNDITDPQLTCIADYHASGPADPVTITGDGTARHCHHRAVYDFPLSKEWLAWAAVDGKALDKDDLGEHIEAQAMDIMDPTAAILSKKEGSENEPWENRLIRTGLQLQSRYGQLYEMLDISKRFSVYETSDLTAETNRNTGEQEIHFLNEHKTADGKPVNIPNLIIIAIPVFEGGAPYRMVVRFRYRKMGGAVKFFLTMYNPEKAFDAAFEEATSEAIAKTDLPLFMGAPEA
jgi:hypothetical protein